MSTRSLLKDSGSLATETWWWALVPPCWRPKRFLTAQVSVVSWCVLSLGKLMTGCVAAVSGNHSSFSTSPSTSNLTGGSLSRTLTMMPCSWHSSLTPRPSNTMSGRV